MKVHRHVARTLAVAALSLVAFAGSASATSISIVNGSFEDGVDADGFVTLSTGATGADIDGWKVGGSIDYIGTYWQAADGNRSLDMNGYFAAGRVEQDDNHTRQSAAGARFDDNAADDLRRGARGEPGECRQHAGGADQGMTGEALARAHGILSARRRGYDVARRARAIVRCGRWWRPSQKVHVIVLYIAKYLTSDTGFRT